MSALVLATALLVPSQAEEMPKEVPLWPAGAPAVAAFAHTQPETSEDKRETGRTDRWISYVSQPTLTVYPADPAKATGAAVLIIPGGGYRYVCVDKEGVEPALWLSRLGITAVVYKYRTLDPEKERSAKTIKPILAETSRAVRVLRSHAKEWGIDPRKIGVLGFSAGGVMAAQLMAEPDAGDSGAADLVERESNRVDFGLLVYAAPPPGKYALAEGLPPVFIVHAADDPKAKASGALSIFKAVTEAKGSAELHVYRSGDHGFGVQPAAGTARAWPAAAVTWMTDLGLVSPTE